MGDRSNPKGAEAFAQRKRFDYHAVRTFRQLWRYTVPAAASPTVHVTAGRKIAHQLHMATSCFSEVHFACSSSSALLAVLWQRCMHMCSERARAHGHTLVHHCPGTTVLDLVAVQMPPLALIWSIALTGA